MLPKAWISVPARIGKTHAIKRAALKMNAAAVARTLDVKSSAGYIAIHEYAQPSVKNR